MTAKVTKTRKPKAKATKTVLVMRTCNADGTSSGGFQWPEKGRVEAPDWKATFSCGNGLHGLLWGEGNGGYLGWESGAIWKVVEVAESDLLHGEGELRDKCKFRCGIVVYSGDRFGAVKYIETHGGQGRNIVGGTATAGDRGTATAGDRGTATAGYMGTATAGDRGTATAGDRGTATAGYGGTATAGDGGTATAGDGCTATAGDRGTATAGYMGTATAGDGGTATAGYRGTATAGDRGTATAGYGGTATAGESGIVVIEHWDAQKKKYIRIVGVVGEGGIEPRVKYRVGDEMKLVETK